MARRQSMCRHCYSYGHTKRSCPQVKQIIAQNPNSYLAQDMKRKCGFCREAGHTRAKCPDLAEKRRLQRIKILEDRTNVCNALTDMGIAPGALVRAECYVPNDSATRKRGWHTLPAIVNKVNWGDIAKSYSDCLEIVFPEYNIITSTRPPKHNLIKDNWSETSVLAPMSKEAAKHYNETQMENTNEYVLKRYTK
jgi:hypothetical protein